MQRMRAQAAWEKHEGNHHKEEAVDERAITQEAKAGFGMCNIFFGKISMCQHSTSNARKMVCAEASTVFQNYRWS
jgi:hypothetical protein